MLERREFLSFTPSQKPPSDGFWLHVSRPAMACRFEVTLPLSDRRGVIVARRALEEADRLEQQLSIFRESSEVSHLNREGATRPIRVERTLFDLLRLSQDLFSETGGAFDITSGPLSQSWGFLRRQGRIPEPSELRKTLSRVGSDKIILNSELGTVRFEHPGVAINFGSIGKGYALDRIAVLIREEIQTAILNAGSSSMLAIGDGGRGENGWSVGIRHPGKKNRRLAVLRLRNAALSTSGNEEQFFEHEGKRRGHIIDPRNGQPAEGVAAVTVVAQSAAIADALATAFYVCGPELAQAYCVSHPQTLVIMLEAGADLPCVFGENSNCDLELIDE